MLPLAEISDKMPSIAQIGVIGLAVGLVSLGLGLYRRRLIFAPLPLLILLAHVMANEIGDAQFGAAVISELGESYIVGSWVALVGPYVISKTAFLVAQKTPATHPDNHKRLAYATGTHTDTMGMR